MSKKISPEMSSPDENELVDKNDRPEQGDEKQEVVPEITPEAKELMDQMESVFEKFFKYMRRYREGEWNVTKLKAQSENLRPILSEFEQILEAGGARDQHRIESLIGTVIEQAQKSRFVEHFWKSISDHAHIPAGTDMEKFYSYFTAGLKKQTESKKEQPVS
ncbi:hypothetical protein KKF61_05835 [Patescibacteria group bacterium]|nr:hypothetical protein [Patescibacteria group bacterium]